VTSQSPRCYLFAPFRLDPAGRVLLRDGRHVPLTPKAFDTLLLLVRNSGRVVASDELMKQVWPDQFVEEGNLKVTVCMLRKALGEPPGERQYIQTVPKRGYRFVADVVESDEVAEPEARGRGESAVAEGTPVKSIAVLPFKLLDAGGGDDEYLGVGMADTLITRLSRLRQVVVRPTSAVRKYAGHDQDPVAAGRELRVAAVLDGNIRRRGVRVRVTAQLIGVETGAPLWAGKFDAQLMEDIFAVEDSISERAAEALAVELSGEEVGLLTKRHTGNVEAYQLYLKGRHHWMKRTSEGIRKSIEFFRQSVDIDPNYALAYTGLADGFAQLGWIRLLPPKDVLPKAKAAAAKALELDRTLAEAHTSLAWARLLHDWEWAEAESGFKRAIELNPGYATARLWYCVHLMATGRFEAALAEIGRAQALDPLSPVINAVAGWPFYFMRRYDAAIKQYQKALEVEPRNIAALLLLGQTYRQSGEPSRAVEASRKARELDESLWTLVALGQAYAAAGREGAAREVLRELGQLSKQRYVCPYDIACLHVGLGEKDQALRWLQSAYEARSSWLFFLAVDPAFDSLRPDPRFTALLRLIGLSNVRVMPT
jgi:DNA-binding winged helix-turn-helix (wHTH) protein/tetratricopeptide (TPR) repeat protein